MTEREKRAYTQINTLAELHTSSPVEDLTDVEWLYLCYMSQGCERGEACKALGLTWAQAIKVERLPAYQREMLAIQHARLISEGVPQAIATLLDQTMHTGKADKWTAQNAAREVIRIAGASQEESEQMFIVQFDGSVPTPGQPNNYSATELDSKDGSCADIGTVV